MTNLLNRNDVLSRIGWNHSRLEYLIESRQLKPYLREGEQFFDPTEVNNALRDDTSSKSPVLSVSQLNTLLDLCDRGGGKLMGALRHKHTGAVLKLLGKPNLQNCLETGDIDSEDDAQVLQTFARMNAHDFLQARNLTKVWDSGFEVDTWVAKTQRLISLCREGALAAASKERPFTRETQQALLDGLDELKSLVRLFELMAKFESFAEGDTLGDIVNGAVKLLTSRLPDKFSHQIAIEQLEEIRKSVACAKPIGSASQN